MIAKENCDFCLEHVCIPVKKHIIIYVSELRIALKPVGTASSSCQKSKQVTFCIHSKNGYTIQYLHLDQRKCLNNCTWASKYRSNVSGGYTIPHHSLCRPTSPRCNELGVRGQLLSYDYCDHWGAQRVGCRVRGMSHSPLSCHRSPPEARSPLTDRCK